MWRGWFVSHCVCAGRGCRALPWLRQRNSSGQTVWRRSETAQWKMGAKINRTHSFSFQSQHNRELQQTWWQVAVTKTWQPIFPRLFSWRVQEPNSCLECMCVRRMCVLCAGGEKLHCVSLLAYANVTGECGSWCSTRRIRAAWKFCLQIRWSCRAQF